MLPSNKMRLGIVATLLSIAFSFLVIDLVSAEVKDPLKSSSGFIKTNNVFNGKLDINIGGIPTSIPLKAAMENDKVDIPKNVMCVFGLQYANASMDNGKLVFSRPVAYDGEEIIILAPEKKVRMAGIASCA